MLAQVAPPPHVSVVGSSLRRVTFDVGAAGRRYHGEVQLLDAVGRVRFVRAVRPLRASRVTVPLPAWRLVSGEYRLRVRLSVGAGRRGVAVSPWLAARVPGPVRIVRELPGAGRECALTFDDGYDGPSTLGVLHTLAAARAPATLFINGTHFAHLPRVVRRVRAMLVKGQVTLGNHTWNHPDLTRLDAGRIRSELEGDRLQAARLFARSSLPYLRPPYGAINSAVRAVAGADGYTTLMLWSVDPADYLRPAVPVVIARVGRQLSPGAIVLMHLDATTRAALPGVIALIRGRGYRIVSLPRLFADA